MFIMAAGLGTRMKSDLPKVLHRIAGRPMLHWVVAAARELTEYLRTHPNDPPARRVLASLQVPGGGQ